MKEVTTPMPLIAPERVLSTDGTPTRVDERTWSVVAGGREAGIGFDLPAGPPVVLLAEPGERHLLPDDASAPVDLAGHGACWRLPQESGSGAYELNHRIEQDAFEPVNDAAHTRSFELDLSALGGTGTQHGGGPRTVVLAPGESVRVTLPDTTAAAGAEGRA